MYSEEEFVAILRYCKPSIYRLADTVLSGRLRNYADPSPMHEQFNSSFLHSENNVSIEWFREAGKTTSVWGLTPCYNVMFGLYDYTAFIGESQDKAEGYLNSFTRSYIQDTPAMAPFVKDIQYKAGRLEVVNWQDKKLLWKCLGSGKSARGLSEGSIRPNLVVLDDITTTEQGESEGATQIKKQNGWYFSDIDPLAAGAKFIIVGTCVHELCLSHQFATNPPVGDPEVGVRNWDGYTYGVLDQDGNPIWPEVRPMEWIEAKRRQFESAGQLGKFYTEYMNQPVADEERVFNNLDRIDDILVEQMQAMTGNEDKIIVVDPAPSDEKSKKRGRDYTVIVAGSKVGGQYFAIDAMRFREDLEYQIDAIFKMWEKYEPQTIWIEDFGAQTYLLQAFKSECKRRGIYISVRGTKEMELNHKGKHPRIQNLKPIISEHKLVVPVAHPVLGSVLREELHSYPKGKHDDVADAVSYLPLLLKGGEARDFSYEDLVGPSALT